MPTLSLCFDGEDEVFAGNLAKALMAAGIAVTLRPMSRKADDLHTFTEREKFFCVVLSPASIGTAWLENLVSKEIEEGSVKILPILHRECPLPLLLKDKVYTELRFGPNRRGIEDITRVVGGRYKHFRKKQRWKSFDLDQWIRDGLRQVVEELRVHYLSALRVSASLPIIPDEPLIPIPLYIETKFSIPLRAQLAAHVCMDIVNIDRVFGIKGRIPGGGHGLEQRYIERFGRLPARKSVNSRRYILSYSEIRELDIATVEISLMKDEPTDQ